MKTLINNWIEQDKLFGLDYTTAKATVGDYSFDIRYDADQMDSTKKPLNCALFLGIFYKKVRLVDMLVFSLESAKNNAEIWLHNELSTYSQRNPISCDPLKTVKISLNPVKKTDTWDNLAYDLLYDKFKQEHPEITDEDSLSGKFYETVVTGIFQYGEFANIQIEVDENLNIVGGKIIPFKEYK